MNRERTALFLLFGGLGATTSLIPAMLPSARMQFGDDIALAIPLLFAGLLLGVLLAAPLLGRVATSHVAAIGVAAELAGVLLFVFAPSLGLAFAGVGLAGAGFGIAETAGNLAAKSLARHTTAGFLAQLTGTVAVVACVTPLVVAGLVGSAAWAVPALAVALLHAVTIALLAQRVQAAAPTPMRIPRGRARLVLPVAVTLVLFVGVESVFSGWSALFAETLLSLSPAAAALGTSAFWLLMALGRFGFAGIVQQVPRPAVVFGVGMIVCAALLATAAIMRDNGIVVAICIALAVVCLAPGYSAVLGVALDALPNAEAPPVVAALIAAGAIGGSLIPAAVLAGTGTTTGSATLFVCAVLALGISCVPLASLRKTQV